MRLHAQVLNSGVTPNYPAGGLGNSAAAMHGRNNWYAYQAYGSTHKEQANQIKQAIGLTGLSQRDGNDTSAVNGANLAARQQAQQRTAMDQFNAMQNSQSAYVDQTNTGTAGGVHSANATPQDKLMTEHERRVYEYYQQCIPQLKSVPVEMIPAYIQQKPALAAQVQQLQSHIDQAQQRMAQMAHVAYAQQQQMHHPQHAGHAGAGGTYGGHPHDPKHQQWTHYQQAQQQAYMQQLAMRQHQVHQQQQSQAQGVAGAQAQAQAQAAYLSQQGYTPAQQQQYFQQQHAYYQQQHYYQQQMLHAQRQQQQAVAAAQQQQH